MAGLNQPIAKPQQPPAPPVGNAIAPAPLASGNNAATPPAPLAAGAPPAPSDPGSGNGAPATQAAPGAPTPPSGGASSGTGDQATYTRFVTNGMNAVSGALPQILKMIAQSQDKLSALAHATVQVVQRVQDSATQAGLNITPDIVFQGGAELLADIAATSAKTGTYTFSQAEINQAFLLAVDMYRMAMQQQGKIDPQQYQQELAQLKTAQQNGTLDQQMPGLTQAAQASVKGAKKMQGKAKSAPAPNGASSNSPTPAPSAPPNTNAGTPARGPGLPPAVSGLLNQKAGA